MFIGFCYSCGKKLHKCFLRNKQPCAQVSKGLAAFRRGGDRKSIPFSRVGAVCKYTPCRCAPARGACCIPRRYTHFILNLPLSFKGEQLIPNQAINSLRECRHSPPLLGAGRARAGWRGAVWLRAVLTRRSCAVPGACQTRGRTRYGKPHWCIRVHGVFGKDQRRCEGGF